MQRFGYLDGNVTAHPGALLDEKDVISGISQVQRFAGLPATGKLDQETLKVDLLFRNGMKQCLDVNGELMMLN